MQGEAAGAKRERGRNDGSHAGEEQGSAGDGCSLSEPEVLQERQSGLRPRVHEADKDGKGLRLARAPARRTPIVG